MIKPLCQRFLEKTMFEPMSGCWVWHGANTRPGNGYGRIFHEGRLWCAHIVSYMSFIGDVPAGMNVLHSCDNPFCVNPQHLFIGTQRDNVLDMVKKGRMNTTNAPKGEAHCNSKLKVSDILSIREDTRSATEIMKQHGISRGTVWKIKHRNRWGWLK